MDEHEFFLSVGGRPVPQGAGAGARPAAAPAYDFGWRQDPAAVGRVLAELPMPHFAAAAPHLQGAGEGKTVLLSDAVKKVLGRHMPAQKQPRGTCVSRGWSRGVDYLQCVVIAQGGPLEFRFASHAYIYGCGAEVGNDHNTQDGLVGAWAAKAVATFGNIANEDCDDRDADYDDLAVEWKARGVPKKFVDLGKQRVVKTVSMVSAPEAARDALCSGYPVPVCSGQGFTMQRDSQGRCAPRGSWQHCMLWSGYRDDRRQFLVEQSWGQNTPSGPLGDLDIPDNAFWIDWDVAAKMLRGQDSFAMSQFDGWPAQTLDWLV